jgi:hypothetical protein
MKQTIQNKENNIMSDIHNYSMPIEDLARIEDPQEMKEFLESYDMGSFDLDDTRYDQDTDNYEDNSPSY